MFFYFCKVLFSDFLQFNGNSVDAQNNSEYRDWAPLRLIVLQRYFLSLILNPLNPGAFCEKGVSWTFWWFLGWISAKLASIWSKMHLHHGSMAFLPPASRVATFWLGHAQKSKFWEIFDIFFFGFSFFSFSFLFAAVIDLQLGLLAVKKLLGKRHRDGQLSPWGSPV